MRCGGCWGGRGGWGGWGGGARGGPGGGGARLWGGGGGLWGGGGWGWGGGGGGWGGWGWGWGGWGWGGGCGGGGWVMVSLRSVVGRVRGGPGLVGRGVRADGGVLVDVAGLAEFVDGADPVVRAAVAQRVGEVTVALAGGPVSAGGMRQVLD